MPNKFITDGLKVLCWVVGEVRAEEHVRLLELFDLAGEVGPGAYIICIKYLCNKYQILINYFYSLSLPGAGLDAAVVGRQHPRHLQVQRPRPVPLRAQELA